MSVVALPKYTLAIYHSMSRSHKAQRLANHVRVSWEIFSRYLGFPLRLLRHLFHALLRLYSRIASRRLQHIHTNGRLERIAGSNQPSNSWNDQLPLPPGGAPVTNNAFISMPIPTAPLSSTHALQPPTATTVSINLQNFEPFTPSEVMRYGKTASM
jgi:hypothetical protein